MTWEDLALYIHVNTHDGFLAACKGVPIEHIRECERGLGIVFPRLYVDFLMAMGVDACGFPPMGGPYDHNFYVLLEHLGQPDYPSDRYFRVGYQLDDVDVAEPCLDLVHSADGDTPLVEIPSDMPFRSEYVRKSGRTLAEHLAWVANLYFGLARPRRRSLMAYCETLPELLGMRDHAMVLLGRLGLKLELSPSPFFMCVGNTELSARIQIPGERKTVISIALAGYDDRQVRRTVEILRDAVPDLEEMQTWMPDD